MNAKSPALDPRSGLTKDITPLVKRRLAVCVPVAIVLFLSFCFLPYAGIQNDEALFAGPLYAPVLKQFSMRAFQHDIPLMILPYLGTAKTALYAMLFRLHAPGIFSLRIPVVVFGALTVGLLFAFLRRAAGEWIALTAALLLATDATFVLSNVFDWGPVAIQHVAYAAGLFCVLSAYQRKGTVLLFAGFVAFGLGMWDKALFIWILSGSAVAAAALFPSQLKQMLNRRNIAAAILGFSIGALPLIVYNIRHPLATFRGNTNFSLAELPRKAAFARRTLSGSALFGYIVFDEWAPAAKSPRNLFERASVGLREKTGQHRTNILFPAFVVSAFAVPLWWRRRKLVLFSLLTLAIAWLQMALNKETGGGVHHVVLLWPLPHIVIAAALCEGARRLPRFSRFTAAALLLLLCGSNLLLANQYLCQFVRNGTAPIWTDAIFPLSQYLGEHSDRNIFLADWGMVDTLVLLHQGRLQLGVLDPLAEHPTREEFQTVQWMITHPGALFVTHTEKFEAIPGFAERLNRITGELGYRRNVVAVIRDSNSRPAFEIATYTAERQH